MPMLALVPPVFDCLMRLAQPDALLNEEEVRIDPLYEEKALFSNYRTDPLTFAAAGGLSGAAATSDWRAARECKQTEDGRAFFPAARWVPAAGRPQLHVPPAAA